MSWKGGLYRTIRRSANRGTDRNDRDRSEERACGNKIKHETWRDAEEHVRGIIEHNIEREREHRSSRLHAYRCDYCGFWHVGHGRGPEAEPWIGK